MGVSTVYYGAGTRGLQVFSTLRNKGNTTKSESAGQTETRLSMGCRTFANL
jgi:hypothetical protein